MPRPGRHPLIVLAIGLVFLAASVVLATAMDVFDPAAAGAAEAAELVMAYTASRAPANTGEAFTLTARIENEGPNAAANLETKIDLPANATILTTPGGCTQNGLLLTCDLASLASGAQHSYALSVKRESPGAVQSDVKVTSTTPDPQPFNDEKSLQVEVLQAPEATEADLTLTKTDSKDPVAIGEEFSYTFRVDNHGPQAVAPFSVTDFIPAPLEYIPGNPDCSFTEGQVACNFGTIAAGGHAEETFVVEPEPGGPVPTTITNRASIQATDNFDPHPEDDEASQSTTLIAPAGPKADLAVGLADSKDPVKVGEEFSYALTVKNGGPDTAPGVEAAVVLPLSLEVKRLDPGCTNAGGTVSCAIGGLANGATAARTIAVVATSAGKKTVSASVASTSTDLEPANDHATQTTEVTEATTAPPAPTPTPTPTPIGPTPVPPGLTLTAPSKTPTSGYSVIGLNTSGSVSGTRIKVDGASAFNVNPTATFVGFSFPRGGTHTITATTIGIGGGLVSRTTSVTAQPITGVRALPFLPQIGIFGSSLKVLLESLKNAQCAPNSTVVFGVVEAQGCFRAINPATELPRSEQAVAQEFVSENFLIETLSRQRPCRYGDPQCKREAGSAFQANPALKPFASTQPVHVDGMTISPRPGASVVVFPALKRIVSSNARISFDGSVFGSIPVESGKINLDLSSGVLHFKDGDERLHVFSFDTTKAFRDIGGFPINGKVDVYLQKKEEKRTTALEVNLSLPEDISTAAGADPTAKVEVNADNQRGTYLGFLNIHINEAFLGPVELANVDFTYNDAGNKAEGCERKWWKATAEIFFLSDDEDGAGLKLAPEPQRNGIAFCAGEFHSAGADLKFGVPIPPPEIFPGVSLNEIGFSIQVKHPLVFDGFAKIKSAEVVTATGGFLAAFASPRYPYVFNANDAGGALGQLAGQKFESTTVALGGKVEIEPLEDVNLELGSAYLLYSYPDFIVAKGSAHLQTFLFAINAAASFELSTATKRFNALVEGQVCLVGGIKIEGIGLCAGGEARVSSRGMSVCFNIGDGTWTPGVGVLYRNAQGHPIFPRPEFFAGALGDGCKPSHFWDVDVRGSRIEALRAAPPGFRARPAAKVAREASAPVAFTVKPGETTKNVELRGAGGAPALTVIAPDGEQISSEPNLMRHGKRLSVITDDEVDTAWVGVENAVPGTYRVVLAPGSAPIAQMKETHYEPNAKVSASVTGKGRRLVLHYDAGQAKDQSVSFFERGKGTWNLLKTVGGGKGTLAFTPSFGPGGRRTIAAQVEVDGIPAPLQTLAHYKAPAPPRASKVAGVKVVRHGSKLSVSWRKQPFAKGYSVVTEASGGAVTSLHVEAKRASATVKGVAAFEGGRVEVVAFGPLGDRGKAGTAKFTALSKPPPSRLLPYKELGTGSAYKFDRAAEGGGKGAKAGSKG
jgi:uncharacterized repeat protein (TIGR01451 family)